MRDPASNPQRKLPKPDHILVQDLREELCTYYLLGATQFEKPCIARADLAFSVVSLFIHSFIRACARVL